MCGELRDKCTINSFALQSDKCNISPQHVQFSTKMKRLGKRGKTSTEIIPTAIKKCTGQNKMKLNKANSESTDISMS